VRLGEFWGSPVNGVTYYLRTCVGEVFGLRAGARGLGGGQGARDEVLSVKIP
jgi:hypothetical protein